MGPGRYMESLDGCRKILLCPQPSLEHPNILANRCF
jgi:hypothetical protein